MLQTLTLYIELISTFVKYICTTFPFFITFFQLFKHKPSITFLSLLHNMSSSFVKWLVHYNGQIIKTDERDMFQCLHPLFFQTKRGLTLEALKRKIHERLHLQPLDQVCDISFWYPQVIGHEMLKFIAVQLVYDEDVKCMIFVIRQTDILQCCELYANIKRNTLPTPNPELVPHQPRYYPQFHYSHTSDATQDTFALTQPQQNLFELNTFSFTQLVSAPFPTNFLNTQAIDATEDQPHPYLSIPTIESTLSTLPTELEFTTEPDLTNNSIPLVRMKTKFYIINPKRKMMRKKFSLFDQSQPYHHTTYHHTCKIMKNPIFKILNTAIAWIAKKSNIRWRLSLKGCVAW